MMKTTIKRLSVLLLAICMICALAAPKDVQAAVSKSTKKKLNSSNHTPGACTGTIYDYSREHVPRQ